MADPRSLSLRSLFLCLLCGQHHAATGTRYPFSCLCEATAAGLETDLETDEVRQGLRPGALVCSLETDLAVVAICSTGTSAPPLGLELCVPEGKPRVVLAVLQALILPRGDILSITYVTSNYELQSLLNEWSIPSSKTQDRPSSGAISPCRRRVPGQCSAHTQCAEYSVGRESMASHLCLPVYHSFCPALFKLAGPKVGSLEKK